MMNLSTFQKTVATAGTPVQLDDVEVAAEQTILIKAKTGNAGIITIGNSSDTADSGNSDYFSLAAGEAIEVDGQNTNEVWIDATENGDGVEVAVS